VLGGWRREHSKEFHDMYSSSKMISDRNKASNTGTAYTGDTTNAYRRWREHDSTMIWYLPMSSHGFTTQNANTNIFPTVRTPKHTQ
jgi:hypothetical protein